MTLRDVSGGFGALDYRPQTGAGRFANRVGQEIGASALPAGAAVAYGGRFVPAAGAPSAAHEGVRQLVEPFVRNPGAAFSREIAGATAAGVGAATANAAHDAVTGGEGGAWWTDLLGGIGGLGVAGAVEGLGRTSADIYRRVGNDPRHQQQIAGEAYGDIERWSRMSLLNTARSGKFSSDRTIRQYCADIWNLNVPDGGK